MIRECSVRRICENDLGLQIPKNKKVELHSYSSAPYSPRSAKNNFHMRSIDIPILPNTLYSQCFLSIGKCFYIVGYKLFKFCRLSIGYYLHPISCLRFFLKPWEIVKHNHYQNKHQRCFFSSFC